MSQSPILYSLQYLRAIAALLVVYSHAVQQHEVYRPWLPYYGDVGVDIFFIISGFILIWIARDSDTSWQFFMRRVRRIVPLYWFFTLLMAGLFIAAPSLFRGAEFDVATLLKSLFFIPHWSSGYPENVWPLVVPGWSLNYEMYFYVIFAVALLLPRRWRVLFTCSVITGIFVFANLMPAGSAWQDFLKQSIFLEFILGMLLALNFKHGPGLSRLASLTLMFLGVAFLILQPLFVAIPMARVLQFGVPALLVVAGMLYLAPGRNRFGLLLGDSSYALYLSHGFVLGAWRVVLPGYPEGGAVAAWFFLLTALVVSVIVGILVHWIIDRWLLRRDFRLFIMAAMGKVYNRIHHSLSYKQ